MLKETNCYYESGIYFLDYQMRYMYSLCWYFLLPFLLVRLWWKGRKIPAYRQRWSERLGIKTGEPVDIWIHAVSLGEVITVIPLVESLLARDLGWRILITTTTPTGSERVQKYFTMRVMHQYLPYDFPVAVKRFFRELQPRLGLIMETELWPNLYHAAFRAKIPLILINARLSPKSYQKYKNIKFVVKPMLQKLAMIFAQTNEDAKRFKRLGAADNKIEVMGNMKFDLLPLQVEKLILAKWRDYWQKNKQIFLVASTHYPEEKMILSCYHELKSLIPNLLLLIAPRHPERFAEVIECSRLFGLNTGVRSDENSLSFSNEAIVIDSLGELLSFYQISNYAFVGGSLIPHGGHNVLEAISMQTPVITGIYYDNFKDICERLAKEQGLLVVRDTKELIAAVKKLAEDESLRRGLITNASAVLNRNKGAVEFCRQRIISLLDKDC